MKFEGIHLYSPFSLLPGGDDVQQLCDAGEEEFLEIMALVGMAAKPLHVRRFQKALQEWLTNPCTKKFDLEVLSLPNVVDKKVHSMWSRLAT